MAVPRSLIVNADDFGYSSWVNRGVLEAHDRGIVTSASLMVRQPRAEEAVAASWSRPGLDLGLHLDLGEWAYRDGDWMALYERVPQQDAAAVGREIRAQLASFRELVGRDPSHLDSHQHVHLREPARSAARELADELALPLRGFASGLAYCGTFYGQTAEGEPLPELITPSALSDLIGRLPPGTTELLCHPGDPRDADVSAVETMYVMERALELRALCDPGVRDALARHGIELSTFAAVAAGRA